MKNYSSLSDSDKWKVVVSCDDSYDGLFFYGVKTTGIFCRPSCRAKTPVRENVVFFNNSKDAIDEGFRPCKKCRPDMEVFEPDLELVRKAKDIFDSNYDNTIDIRDTARQLGVSENHLTRLFRKQFGLTPIHYITGLRISKAVELLGRPDASILEVADITGFKSISNFYRCFKARTGITPKEYRKNGGRNNADSIL